MAAQRRILGIELRFRLSAALEVWETTLSTLFTWESRLQPTHVNRLTDLDVDEPQLWSNDLARELARRCANGQRFSWVLLREDDRGSTVMVSRWPSEVKISVGLPEPTSDSVALLLGLLNAFQNVYRPALVMLHDLGDDEGEFRREGLVGLSDLPSILYIDLDAVVLMGGKARVLAAPCETLETPDGGVLLICREMFWGPLSDADQANLAELRHYFGITPETPLQLLPATEGQPVTPNKASSSSTQDQLVTLTSSYKGATVTDYIEEHGDFSECVVLLSMPLNRGPLCRGVYQRAIVEARRRRHTAPHEAGNLPDTHKLSLHYVRDPGPASRVAMLDILFRDDSPIYRVKFGKTWYGPS